MTAGSRGGIDPGLKAILDSIRQTVTGDPAAEKLQAESDPGADTPAEAEAEPKRAEAAAPARPRKALRADLPASDKTVEEFLADLIRPQVDAWLAAHLPEIVQKLAADEIKRLTGGK